MNAITLLFSKFANPGKKKRASKRSVRYHRVCLRSPALASSCNLLILAQSHYHGKKNIVVIHSRTFNCPLNNKKSYYCPKILNFTPLSPLLLEASHIKWGRKTTLDHLELCLRCSRAGDIASVRLSGKWSVIIYHIRIRIDV